MAKSIFGIWIRDATISNNIHSHAFFEIKEKQINYDQFVCASFFNLDNNTAVYGLHWLIHIPDVRQ